MKAVLKTLRTPAFAVPMALWIAMWLNLNTGPWLLDGPTGAWRVLVFLRVYAPTGVLVLSLLALMGSRSISNGMSPTLLLTIYGVIAAIAGTQSPDPSWATYWSIAFLASVAVSRLVLSVRDPGAATTFLWATWFAVLIVTIGIIRGGGSAIWQGGDRDYTIGNHIDIIASGVSRWAAVCSFLCLAVFSQIRPWLPRLALLAASAPGFVMVYKMQSRGTVFGTVAGLLFLLLVERRTRRWAIPVLLLSVLVIYGYYRHQVSSDVMTYLERGGGKKGLYTMTGRTEAWDLGWQAFKEAPLFGRGQWADRLLDVGHVHNTLIQALLNGGIVGFIPYLLSWAAAWRLFFRLWKRRKYLAPLERISLLQCGALLAFFSVRAVPETTTASYSPDLLMMLAVYAFLEKTTTLARVPAPIPYVLVLRRPPNQISVTA
jgi:O-antigen ligase